MASCRYQNIEDGDMEREREREGEKKHQPQINDRKLECNDSTPTKSGWFTIRSILTS